MVGYTVLSSETKAAELPRQENFGRTDGGSSALTSIDTHPFISFIIIIIIIIITWGQSEVSVWLAYTIFIRLFSYLGIYLFKLLNYSFSTLWLLRMENTSGHKKSFCHI